MDIREVGAGSVAVGEDVAVVEFQRRRSKDLQATLIGGAYSQNIELRSEAVGAIVVAPRRMTELVKPVQIVLLCKSKPLMLVLADYLSEMN